MSSLPSTPRRQRAVLPIAMLVLLAVASACATTGATFGSGVGDRQLERPPYYAGATVSPAATAVARLPIVYQRGGAQAAIFDPKSEPGTPMARLLEDMNAYLDSLGVGVKVASTSVPSGTPPDVHFGCNRDALDECTASESGAGILARSGPTMRLAVGRPSQSWVQALGPALDEAGAQSALVITLEVGEYWTRQKSWRGDKAVDLGTNYSQDVPWLTSLEAPVQVLQLTGALVGRDGRAIRIGAEGIFARRSSIVESGFGLTALLSDEDIERIRTLRRTDVPGQPLAWQVALRTLVGELTGQAPVGDF